MHPIRSMIDLDDAKFRQILDVTVGPQALAPRDIPAVVELVQLAAAIDLDDEPGEQTVLQALTARLCAVAGLPPDAVPRLSRIPTDDEERAARLAALVPRLTTTGARDLAFALSYLVIVADLELGPVESSLLQQLQRTLGIPADRAGEVVAAAAAIVTPDDAPDGSDESDGRDRRAPVVAYPC